MIRSSIAQVSLPQVGVLLWNASLSHNLVSNAGRRKF